MKSYEFRVSSKEAGEVVQADRSSTGADKMKEIAARHGITLPDEGDIAIVIVKPEHILAEIKRLVEKL